jgi:hypothetical protein
MSAERRGATYRLLGHVERIPSTLRRTLWQMDSRQNLIVPGPLQRTGQQAGLGEVPLHDAAVPREAKVEDCARVSVCVMGSRELGKLESWEVRKVDAGMAYSQLNICARIGWAGREKLRLNE